MVSKDIMAMQLFERPGYMAEPRRHGFGAFLSITLHFGVAATLIAVLQIASQQDPVRPRTEFSPVKLNWIPNLDLGGGRSGGDRSTEPARPTRLAGSDSASVPVAPQPSATSTADMTIEVVAIPAKTIADATLALVGAIASDSATRELGRGTDGNAGDRDGPGNGAGNGPGPGVGDAMRLGAPGVTTPIAIHQEKPRYTAEAMRVKAQGTVLLECVVLPDGSVGAVKVTRSLDPVFGLDQEAVAAAKRWRFKPGLLNGKPVAVIVTIELMFSLR